MTYQADLAALTVNDWNPKRDMYVECTKYNWNDELYLIKKCIIYQVFQINSGTSVSSLYSFSSAKGKYEFLLFQINIQLHLQDWKNTKK